MLASTLKGMLVAAANVWAVTIVIGAVAMSRGDRGTDSMMVMIAILGLGPALAVGAICGYAAGELPVFRRLTLCAIGLASVVGLGVMTDPRLITQAIPSTVMLALVLERWTRPNLAITIAARPPKQPGSQPSPVSLGLWLGLFNTIAVSLVFALSMPSYHDGSYHHREDHLGLAILMGCLGILPGAGIGAALGCFTKTLQHYRPVVRVLLIALLALLAVAVFVAVPTSIMQSGYQRDPLPLIPPAMVPTMIAVLILERRTRPLERMPAARALA